MRKKKQPIGAKVRACPECPTQFKPMTDRTWVNVYRMHQMSERHKWYVARKAGSNPPESH